MKIQSAGNSFAKKALSHTYIKQEISKLKRVLRKVPQIEWPYKSAKQPGIKILQPALSVWIEQDLLDSGWSANAPLNFDDGNMLGRRIDFVKEDKKSGARILLQIQFGNSGRMYADFYKFLTAYSKKQLTLGVLVVLSKDTAKITDSGLVTFESVVEHMNEGINGATRFPLLTLGLTHEDAPDKTLDFSKGQFDSPKIYSGKGVKKALGAIIFALRHDKSVLPETGLVHPRPRALLKNSLRAPQRKN